MNAILTWLKCFKYLTYFPSIKLLTKTIIYAAGPLGSFSVMITIVLLGFGQAFFLAFGIDLVEYRTIVTSFTALLRMATGDFNYDAMERSHNTVGPGLFWLFIMMVFFIMVSAFISLISNAYDRAKSELAADAAADLSAPPVTDPRDPHNSVEEARTKLRAIVPGQITPKLVDMMKSSLPRKGESLVALALKENQQTSKSAWSSGDSWKTEDLKSKKTSILTELREKRNLKRWKSGPLAHPWERSKPDAPLLDQVYTALPPLTARIYPSLWCCGSHLPKPVLTHLLAHLRDLVGAREPRGLEGYHQCWVGQK